MMNRFVLILITCILAFPAVGQSDVYSALSKGDVAALGTHLDARIELCIFNKEDIFNKEQALVMLREFFDGHAVKGFKQMHSGASKGQDANYSIGQLATDKGTFRVYIYFDSRNDRQIIQELRIETNR